MAGSILRAPVPHKRLTKLSDPALKFCRQPVDCTNDGLQLHMTHMSKTPSGNTASKLHDPYDITTDNRYAVTGMGEIHVYRVHVSRKGNDKFEVETFEVQGTKTKSYMKKKTITIQSGKDSEWMAGAFPQSRQLQISSDGGIGKKLKFYAGCGGVGDFDWESDETGTAGPYCKIEKNGAEITCDVPMLDDVGK